VATAIEKADKTGPHYRVERRISVKGAPVVQIYKRN
jgi:hypothetical protein